MTPQTSFLIITEIIDGHIEELRTLLGSMNNLPGHADPENDLVPFHCFPGLHVARFVILEAHTAFERQEYGEAPREWKPSLAFLGEIDGERNDFFRELVAEAGPGLQQIFSHCKDFNTGQTDLKGWLIANNIKPQANYINWIGRTVRQVREEAALHSSLAARLKEIAETGEEDIFTIRQQLLTHVELEKDGGRLSLTPPAPTPLGWRIRNLAHMIGLPLILLLLLPLIIIIAPFFFWRLRVHERSDPVIFIRPERKHVEELSAIEDYDVTNQFNVLGDVKPGLFRLLTMKFLLMILDYTARHIYKRGYLTRIRTIHFARWVLIDDNHRVFFASNYDGSHESYMDDFINKVAWGLNLVFSNGISYPPTRWLVKGGARHEQMYKATLRRHQIPSAVWYKAYPGLSAYDLSRNHRIRQGVEIRQQSKAEMREWLGLI